MQKLHIDENDRCLILAPHPDDESIGCGGLLLKYHDQCDVVCITDGRQGQGNEKPSELAAVRKREFTDAMSYARVHKYMMIGIADSTLCGHLDALEGLDLSDYNKIFVTGTGDSHPDHTAALTALKKVCKKKIEPTEIYVYEVHRKLKKITHLFSIDEVLEKKKELMRCYFSQMSNYPFDEVVIGINKERGMGKGYREAFCQIELDDIRDELPLETEISKMREYYWVYTRWMRSLQAGGGIAGILKGMGYQSVMIYGFKEFGQLLLKELNIAGIGVPMIIDKRQVGSEDGIAVVRPEEIPDNMKAILVIVTATWYIDEIRKELNDLGIGKIISIKELLDDDD